MLPSRLLALAAAALAASLLTPVRAAAQIGSVDGTQEVSNGAGGFPTLLAEGENFGFSVADLGDFDGDGVSDVVVGAIGDDGNSALSQQGAIWMLMLHADGSVKNATRISSGAGGFPAVLQFQDWFGWSVANLGDVDHDGVTDLAVGALQDDSSGQDNGAVWVLLMNSNKTVKASTRISAGQSGFNTSFGGSFEWFGTSVASIGDLDQDGVRDMAVGAHGDSEMGNFRGAVWLLLLNANGTVKGFLKINDAQGGFSGVLADGDEFGYSLANVGDLDRDGIDDVAVGANLDDDGGQDRGAVYVLQLTTSGAKLTTKISDTDGGFTGVLDNRDQFGRSVAGLGDLDGDGVADLAVGAHWDDDGGKDRGAVWNLFLNEDGTVKGHQKISSLEGGFGGVLANSDELGSGIAVLADIDGDGVRDLAVGADKVDDVLTDSGAAFMLFLEGGPFTNLGKALKGSNGVPALGGLGTLLPGSPMSINLSHAKVSSPAVLVIGASAINAPLKGGTLVPAANALFTFPTNATGHFTIAANWPLNVPPGVSIWCQYWLNDAAGPQHFAASNGLKLTGQ